MSTSAAIVLGLIIGWAIEWIIDWIYWRRQIAEMTRRLEAAEARLPQEADLNKLARIQADLENQIIHNATLQEQLAALEAEKLALQNQVAVRQVALSAVPDDLIVIKGIGPVIARKLNEAGVCTFEALGALTPERLREIVGEAIQRLANEEDIIHQAQKLAAEKDLAHRS